MQKSKLLLLVTLSVLLGAVAGCQSTPPAAPAQSATPAADKPQPDFVRALVELEAMGVELARLRNAIELQRKDMEDMKRRQRELYDDLDFRLRARERGSMPAGPAGAPPVTGQTAYPPIATPQDTPGGAPTMAGATQQPAAGTERGVQRPSTATVEPWRTRPQAAGAQPQTPGQQPTATAPAQVPQAPRLAVADEQSGYDQAFDKLKQSRYAEAIQAFKDLLASYPNGALADDAHYWIAEAQYVTRDFQSALNGFRNLVIRYPDSPRAPEALLKVGYIQYEVGAKEQARVTLNEVVTRYPGSRVAISAQTRLKRIEREGG